MIAYSPTFSYEMERERIARLREYANRMNATDREKVERFWEKYCGHEMIGLFYEKK